ncbi:MAG: formamidopyrimidine-DNA glycosylase [Planctomycetota bacterium]|nr:formamidopyrimidine-DNA glycosylase [Planctomycetota bacterium]
MPELPEVETMVRGIRPFVEGREILSVGRCRCAYRPILIEPSAAAITRRAKRCTIDSVRRIAKRVVLELSNGDAFAVEPRMTGLMLVTDPPDRTHLRYEWKLGPAATSRRNSTAGMSLYFWDRRGLGTIRLYRDGSIHQELGPPKLGLDALAVTAADWRAACDKTQRAIKVAMLDQKFIAGIGNLYASEILHLAGIHPESPARDLTDDAIAKMSAATTRVLETAIKYEGSTLGDGTYRNALNQDGGYQNEHRVYAREGELCPTCNSGLVERFVQTQRSTFFCPTCQRLGESCRVD